MDDVFGDVPALEIAGQNQLGLDFSLAVVPSQDIGQGMVGFDVMAHDLQHGLVGGVDVFELDVQDRVNPVLVHQGPETVFPAEARENGAVAVGCLAVEIKLCGPPTLRAIFKLCPRSQKISATALRGEERIDGNFKTTRLLHLVVVGDEVGPFLSPHHSTSSKVDGDRRQPGKDYACETAEPCDAQSQHVRKGTRLKTLQRITPRGLSAQKDGRQVYEARVLVANESQLYSEGTSRLGNGTIRLQGTAASFIRAQRFARQWEQRLHEAGIRTPIARPFFSWCRGSVRSVAG